MINKSTWQHLRFSFSLNLLPIYFFALSQMPVIDWLSAAICFVVLHVFLYPASNAYNSYYDQDKGPIAGLKNPPPAIKQVYYTSVFFEVIALLLSFWVGWRFAGMVLVYTLISRAYSYDKIRLKQYPYLGWAVVVLFQGAFTYAMVSEAAYDLSALLLQTDMFWIPAGLSTLLLGGFYPLTQVYQHKEDRRRKDITISIKLGVRGTFIWGGLFFFIGTAGFFYWLYPGRLWPQFTMFILLMAPVLSYFLYWWIKVWNDPSWADFKHTMRMNAWAAICLNGFFGYLLLWEKVIV